MSDQSPHYHPSQSYHPHITSFRTYSIVFGALLCLTILTVLVSLADLGALSLPVALIVAGTKATLVAAFFMHLKNEERFNILMFISAGLFLLVFFVFTLADIGVRSHITVKESNDSVFQEKRGEVREALKAASAKKAADAEMKVAPGQGAGGK